MAVTRIQHILIGTLLLTLFSCSKSNTCHVPFGDASCVLDLSMPSLSDLWNINGYVYISGGNKGICVTHPAPREFVAFELTCPHDHDVAVAMDPTSDGLIFECPVCGSRFLAIDGTPLNGSVTSCSLLEYSTSYDGAYKLSIW